MSTPNQKRILSELTEMFHDIQPDEDFIEENEDLASDIADLDEMLHANTETDLDKIRLLYNFNIEWFPDGLVGEHKQHYTDIIKNAEQLLFPLMHETLEPLKKKTLPLFARFDGYIMCDVELFEQDEEEAVRQAIKAGNFQVEDTGYVPDVAYDTNDTMLAPEGEIEF